MFPIAAAEAEPQTVSCPSTRMIWSLNGSKLKPLTQMLELPPSGSSRTVVSSGAVVLGDTWHVEFSQLLQVALTPIHPDELSATRLPWLNWPESPVWAEHENWHSVPATTTEPQPLPEIWVTVSPTTVVSVGQSPLVHPEVDTI